MLLWFLNIPFFLHLLTGKKNSLEANIRSVKSSPFDENIPYRLDGFQKNGLLSEEHLWVHVGNPPTLIISRVLSPKKMVAKRN